jgi:hypothetical protein
VRSRATEAWPAFMHANYSVIWIMTGCIVAEGDVLLFLSKSCVWGLKVLRNGDWGQPLPLSLSRYLYVVNCRESFINKTLPLTFTCSRWGMAGQWNKQQQNQESSWLNKKAKKKKRKSLKKVDFRKQRAFLSFSMFALLTFSFPLSTHFLSFIISKAENPTTPKKTPTPVQLKIDLFHLTYNTI